MAAPRAIQSMIPTRSSGELTDLPGVGDELARRIEYTLYPNAYDKVAADPYRLTDIRGIGFQIADKIARDHFGIANNDEKRIRAGVDFWFQQRALNGHTAASVEDAVVGAEGLLGVSLNGGLKHFFVEDGVCAPYDIREKETAIAEAIRNLAVRECPDLPCVEDGLFEDQIAALRVIQRANVFVLTGAPGVGKTATVKSVMKSNPDARILLCAPTGKAAKRMEELTGASASTMHRALGPQVVQGARGKKFVFSRDETNPLSANLIIIDEASMIDVWLMWRFLKAVPPDARLLLVGDPYQLPSVGPGNVLGDIIGSGVVPYVELTQIKRTAPDLLIARNCARIKNGEVPETRKDASDWFFFERRTPQEISDLIVDLVSKKLPERYRMDPLYDIQTLTALREKSDLSTLALNKRLREIFNPAAMTADITVGDRVICTRNDYKLGVYNGDLGMVMSVERRGLLTIEFETPPRTVTCGRAAIGLELAYALTVHKAQGSEFPFVIIPIHRCLGPLVTRRAWLYTACSRARRATILVGSLGELGEIVKRTQDTQRVTMLKGLLRGDSNA